MKCQKGSYDRDWEINPDNDNGQTKEGKQQGINTQGNKAQVKLRRAEEVHMREQGQWENTGTKGGHRDR